MSNCCKNETKTKQKFELAPAHEAKLIFNFKLAYFKIWENDRENLSTEKKILKR